MRQVLRVRVGRTLIAVAWQNGRSVAAVRRRTALHVRGWGRPCPYSGCGITVVVAAATAAQVSCKGGRTAAPGLPRKTGPAPAGTGIAAPAAPGCRQEVALHNGVGMRRLMRPGRHGPETARTRRGVRLHGQDTPESAPTDPGSAGRPAGRRRTGRIRRGRDVFANPAGGDTSNRSPPPCPVKAPGRLLVPAQGTQRVALAEICLRRIPGRDPSPGQSIPGPPRTGTPNAVRGPCRDGRLHDPGLSVSPGQSTPWPPCACPARPAYGPCWNGQFV